MSQLLFLRQFIKQPRRTSSIIPSARALSRRMTEWIDWSGVRTVVEYGPGTGAFTEHVLGLLDPQTRYTAIEINRAFVTHLRARFADIHVIHDSVEHVEERCHEVGIEQVDVILSGLPWAVLSDAEQHSVLDPTLRILKPGGSFATFGYLHVLGTSGSRKLRRQLRQRFSQVEVSRPAWTNVPPALVYRCRK